MKAVADPTKIIKTSVGWALRGLGLMRSIWFSIWASWVEFKILSVRAKLTWRVVKTDGKPLSEAFTRSDKSPRSSSVNSRSKAMRQSGETRNILDLPSSEHVTRPASPESRSRDRMTQIMEFWEVSFKRRGRICLSFRGEIISGALSLISKV